MCLSDSRSRRGGGRRGLWLRLLLPESPPSSPPFTVEPAVLPALFSPHAPAHHCLCCNISCPQLNQLVPSFLSLQNVLLQLVSGVTHSPLCLPLFPENHFSLLFPSTVPFFSSEKQEKREHDLEFERREKSRLLRIHERKQTFQKKTSKNRSLFRWPVVFQLTSSSSSTTTSRITAVKHAFVGLRRKLESRES